MLVGEVEVGCRTTLPFHRRVADLLVLPPAVVVVFIRSAIVVHASVPVPHSAPISTKAAVAGAEVPKPTKSGATRN